MFLGLGMCVRGLCGSPLFSIVYPSRSCHGYCLTPHVQCCG